MILFILAHKNSALYSEDTWEISAVGSSKIKINDITISIQNTAFPAELCMGITMQP